VGKILDFRASTPIYRGIFPLCKMRKLVENVKVKAPYFVKIWYNVIRLKNKNKEKQMRNQPTLNEVVNKIKTTQNVDKVKIAQGLLDSGYFLDGLKKITINKIVGTALQTATGKNLHSAIFDTSSPEIKLNVYRNNTRIVVSIKA